MQKNRKIKVMIPDSLTAMAQDENTPNAQIKFDLYRKEKEIREISRILRNLSLKGTDEHREWLQENEELVSDLAEEFVDESLYKLDGAQLDSETLELSVQVMTSLRETLGLFQAIISSDRELEA